MYIALTVVGACATLFSILMVFQSNLYAAALCLMAVLLQVAALFFLMGAQLLGLIQVLVYAGAIMVLIVIAAMAVRPQASGLWAEMHLSPWLVAGAILAPLLEMRLLARLGVGAASWGAISPALERQLAPIFFGRYALITEGIGVIVLISALSMLQES